MTDHTEHVLHQCIAEMLSGKMPMDISELEDTEESRLESAFTEMIRQINESYEFSLQLTHGNLKCKPPSYNVLAGPVKDLQSNLRHLLWQVERVAHGDYSHKVEFLGDFSEAFNIYIEQVALREEYQKKVALLEKNNLEQKNQILMMQLDQQLAHYENLKRVYKKIGSVKHDLKNHFFAMDNLLNRKDIKGIRQYLNAMASSIQSDQYTIYDTQNPIFDALLTEKAAIAVQAGIEIDTELAMSPNVKIDNVDWCILLGNALDNAIEACQALDNDNKQIKLKAVSVKNMLNFAIKNTALPPVKTTNGFYETSKEDKANHGLGLTNISDVVHKYDGAIQTEYKDGYFTLICILCGV